MPSQAAFLTEAEPLARKFLEADRIEKLLPLVRNPAQAEPRMRKFYPDGVVKPVGLLVFHSDDSVEQVGKISAVKVRTRDLEERGMAFAPTPEGLKIDWESWVVWCDMTWEKFLETKPTTPVVFRLDLKKVEYYNFDFKDERQWQSYRLTSADGKHAIYGYAQRGAALNSRIAVIEETPDLRLMLALRFPEGGVSNNQVVIDRFVADGWVEDTGEESP